jgi:hypothetical protein
LDLTKINVELTVLRGGVAVRRTTKTKIHCSGKKIHPPKAVFAPVALSDPQANTNSEWWRKTCLNMLEFIRGGNVTNQDVARLELLVQAKQLRFRMVRAAITLGLTLINLAEVEASVGNQDRATWATENAKRLHEEVQDCLSTTELSDEERQWAVENLNQIAEGIGGGSSPKVNDSADI